MMCNDILLVPTIYFPKIHQPWVDICYEFDKRRNQEKKRTKLRANLKGADHGTAVGLLLRARKASANVLHCYQVPLHPWGWFSAHRLLLFLFFFLSAAWRVWVRLLLCFHLRKRSRELRRLRVLGDVIAHSLPFALGVRRCGLMHTHSGFASRDQHLRNQKTK